MNYADLKYSQKKLINSDYYNNKGPLASKRYYVTPCIDIFHRQIMMEVRSKSEDGRTIKGA